MTRQDLIDQSVAIVFLNENMRKVWRRYHMVTESMAIQVRAVFRRLELQSRGHAP